MKSGHDRHIPRRMLFQWHITDRCNLRCRHCYQEKEAGADPSTDQLLSVLEQLKSFIRSCRGVFCDGSYRAHVTVTGGEPFLREDFLFLLQRLAAERHLFSFAVLTNGTLLDGSVESLASLGPAFVQVSLDGTPGTHDLLRGAGSHARAVAGARLLVRHGIPTYISFTANRRNYREFPEVARLARRLGAARIWSDRLVPCNTEERTLGPEEAREFVTMMDRERRRGLSSRSPVVLHRSLQFAVSGSTPYRCSAGDTLVTILPNGDVCPCRRMPVIVGNVHEQPLDHLYQEAAMFCRLRDRSRISMGCEGCFYAHTCGGGARCISLAVHGDPFRADPGCWLAAGTA